VRSQRGTEKAAGLREGAGCLPFDLRGVVTGPTFPCTGPLVADPARFTGEFSLAPTGFVVRFGRGSGLVVAKNGSENLEWAIAFFQQVKQRPGLKKGLLRITL